MAEPEQQGTTVPVTETQPPQEATLNLFPYNEEELAVFEEQSATTSGRQGGLFDMLFTEVISSLVLLMGFKPHAVKGDTGLQMGSRDSLKLQFTSRPQMSDLLDKMDVLKRGLSDMAHQ